VRSAHLHYVIAAGAAIVLVGASPGDLPDVPIAIGMTLAPLTAQRIQRSLIIALIVDAAILAPHD
jgi:hypothetical protein